MSDQAWHDWRRDGIGASDIGALLGLSRWDSPWSLWATKVGLLSPTETTERQQMGHDFEPVIAQLFTRKTGLYVAAEQTWCANPAEPWMRCTVDGFVGEGFEPDGTVVLDIDMSTALGGFEAKTDGRLGWPDGVPDSYEAQAQWSMGVTGMERWWIAVIFSGWRFEVFEVKRDDADIAFMVGRARTFWFDHVLTGTPPPTDGSQATLDALAEVYPEPVEGKSIDLAAIPGLTSTHRLWLYHKNEAKVQKAMAAGHAATLQAALGDAEEGTIDGVPVVSWRKIDRGGYQVEPTSYRQLLPRNPTKD